MFGVSETASFLGAGVHVSYTSASYKANSTSSPQEEESDKIVLRLDATKTNKPEEYLTRSQINMMLAQAKQEQQRSEMQTSTPEVVEPQTTKPESIPETDDDEAMEEEAVQAEKARTEEARPKEVVKEPEKTREEPAPVKAEEKRTDLALEYTRNENEKARETSVREFLTVGMTSRFVEAQATTA